MTNADFHQAIRRIRRWHWFHYLVQAGLMGGVVLAAGRRTAVGSSVEPKLATWPALLLLAALLPLVGVVLFMVSRRLRPNLRRRAEQNMRVYQGRILLRDSVMSLLALPLLGSYVITQQPLDLVGCAAILLALVWQTTPSAQTYQRWLLS